MGVWISSGISDGHISPAVTLALATWRGFPWKKDVVTLTSILALHTHCLFCQSPGFPFAQLLGGIVGGGLVYLNYNHATGIIEGSRHIRTLNTAGLFATYAVGSPHQTRRNLADFKLID